MPDSRDHRGPHPGDLERFAAEQVPTLRAAVAELAWLASRGYPPRAALKLVGDRHRLDARQRVAVRRATCSDEALARRLRHRVDSVEVAGAPLVIDGFNLLTTVEAALAGGLVLGCRDGCFRDMAGMHGTWRRVTETAPALDLVGDRLAELDAGPVCWLLDRPVSNSGRLRARLLDHAERHGRTWTAETVPDPDRLLRDDERIVVSADGGILDKCYRWMNLGRVVIEEAVPTARILELG